MQVSPTPSLVNNMSHCPCGSQKHYKDCCQLYIEAHQRAETPEQLMRSRYTAYSMANIPYIKQTMSGAPLIGYDEQAAKKWAEHAIWIGLEIIESRLETPDLGFVEFVATFIEKNQLKTIHECSEFHRKNNCWFYVNGQAKFTAPNKSTHISRNSSCPCQSGKKFKNCHAR